LHATTQFWNVDGEVNDQPCVHMGDVASGRFFDKYTATFDDVKDDDIYDSSVDSDEKNNQLDKKKTWCKEFLLGFIRLHQFIHVLIDTGTSNTMRNYLKMYLLGQESYTDTEITEHAEDVLLQESDNDKMKKQNLLKFTDKMQLYTWSFAFVINGDGSKTMVDHTVDELATITKNDSNLMPEWIQDVDVVRYERNGLKQEVEKLIKTPPQHKKYKEMTKTVEEKRQSTQEAEYKYKTTNAFVLFEQYYDFKKKAVLYGDEEIRPPRIKHDDTKLYDDSDVSTESSSDENL